MLGRVKETRRVATRYDRCPKAFLSAIALAALVIYWLWALTLEAWISEYDEVLSGQLRESKLYRCTFKFFWIFGSLEACHIFL